MSKEPFDSIMAGLEDALAYAKGDKTRGTVRYYNEKANRESPILLDKERPTKKKRTRKKR